MLCDGSCIGDSKRLPYMLIVIFISFIAPITEQLTIIASLIVGFLLSGRDMYRRKNERRYAYKITTTEF
jgi:hypothetical protein